MSTQKYACIQNTKYQIQDTNLPVLPIITGSTHETLRAKAKPIMKVTKDILRLIKDMEKTVKDAQGLGLAAPQVDVSVRLCLAKINRKMIPLINPTITWRSEKTEVAEEGCLSLPDTGVDVERSTDVVVSYLDHKGREQERKLSGLDARVVQHEIDHLDGVLIVDYL